MHYARVGHCDKCEAKGSLILCWQLIGRLGSELVLIGECANQFFQLFDMKRQKK
jgi:hypothetical protein